jgi:hypothetical protein
MTTPNRDPSDERIEELEREIDDARRQAEEHGTLPSDKPEPTYADPDADGELYESMPEQP